MSQSLFTPEGDPGCSYLYLVTFAVTSIPRSRKADFFGSRFCSFLNIAFISLGRMLFWTPHFVNRSLYCFGLIISQLLAYTRKIRAPYVASSPWFCLMNSIRVGRVSSSYSLVISALWVFQSFVVYFRTSICRPASDGLVWTCDCGSGCVNRLFEGREKKASGGINPSKPA